MQPLAIALPVMSGRLPVGEILSLKCHPVLNRDSASEGADPFDIAIRNGLAMVEKPAESFEWNLSVHRLVHVQCPRNRLIIRCVQPEGPTIFDKTTNYGFEQLSRARVLGSKFPRRGACEPAEDYIELTLACEATSIRHFGERQVCIRKQLLRSFHSALGDVLVWSKTRCLPKQVGEVVGAQSNDCGKRI